MVRKQVTKKSRLGNGPSADRSLAELPIWFFSVANAETRVIQIATTGEGNA